MLDDRASCQEPKQIDEMAGFPNDASAAGIRVARPVSWRNGAGIDSHDQGLRFAQGFEQCFRPDDVRREATVEPDHENRRDPTIRAGGSDGFLDRVDLVQSYGERFFDENVLPSLQRVHYVSCMRVVARGDNDGIDLRI